MIRVRTYLQLLQSEATSSTNLGVVPHGGTPHLWPQGSSDWARSDTAGFSLTSLSSGQSKFGKLSGKVLVLRKNILHLLFKTVYYRHRKLHWMLI